MHDLSRIKQDLQESLSLDKHPVALLIGAGCPVAVRVPSASGGTSPLISDIAGLTATVCTSLAGDASFAKLCEQFKLDGRAAFTVEDLLSQVRLLKRIVGAGDARGLTGSALDCLEIALCDQVVQAVRRDLPNADTAYHHLADWIGGVQRKSSLALFTTNYDLLLEQALEEKSLPYFDGFMGSRRPFFDLRAIEDDAIPTRWTRVWKLHGSLNWRLLKDGVVIRTSEVIPGGGGVLIHPSELKYDQSRRMPYLAMIDQLRSFLRQPSALLITVGYSYADEHLNEVLLQGLRSNPTAAAFGLLYKDLDSEPGAQKLIIRVPTNLNLLARDCGVVRGGRAPWLTVDTKGNGTVATTSDLGDFAVFAKFARDLCTKHWSGANA